MLRPWKFSLAEQINSRCGSPIYLQLVHALIHEIRRGRLAPGAALPSTRELAEELGVNRKTVVLAYDDLIAQGWFSTLGTRGTFVSVQLPEPLPVNSKAKRSSDIRDYAAPEFPFHLVPDPMLVFHGENIITIDDGLPDPRLFPAGTLAGAHRTAALRAARRAGLSYGDPRGSDELRQLIAEMLVTHRGLVVDSENLCITRGSQMGIFLSSRILLSPGDAVLVEGLSYSAARHCFAATGAEVIGVKLDTEGLDVEQVEQLCLNKKVRAVYVTPHHQFPTTVSLSPERRLRLSNLAAKFRFAIVEDDYDHEFHFERQPLLPIASYAPNRTIYIGSMSKLLLPGLRIGFVAAPKAIIKSMANSAAGIDRQGNALTELAVADLIRTGELRRHVRKARKIYVRRRDAFGALLQQKFGKLIDFKVPEGGLAYWVTFPNSSTLDAIEDRAARCGIRFLPSNSFAAPPQRGRGLRLGFGSLDEPEATEAIERLHVAAMPSQKRSNRNGKSVCQH
jgi:GntR family transcriptional regulator/MocR family aminotransferase